MPTRKTFGSQKSYKKLGLANVPLGSSPINFALQVFQLESNATESILCYQQQMVHNTVDTEGNLAAAEILACGSTPDTTSAYLTGIARQVSAHDTKYSRRNYNDADGVASFQFKSHALNSASSNQIYYVNNEPESPAPVTGASCAYEARDRKIDTEFASQFPQPNLSLFNTWFWRVGGDGIEAKALASVYLRAKSWGEAIAGKNHIVLPPNFSEASIGIDPLYEPFFQKFFTSIHANTFRELYT
jgi:hypothetical protein